MSLQKYKKAFEGKLLFEKGYLCDTVSIINVNSNKKKYNFYVSK